MILMPFHSVSTVLIQQLWSLTSFETLFGHTQIGSFFLTPGSRGDVQSDGNVAKQLFPAKAILNFLVGHFQGPVLGVFTAPIFPDRGH